MAKYRVLPTGRVQVIKDPMPPKSKRFLKILLGTIALLFAYVMWWISQPYTNTTHEYILCRTFIELDLQYPTTLRMFEVRDFDESIRIYFRALDSYGNVVSRMGECIFRPDPETRIALDSFSYDRRPYEDVEAIAEFNKTIPIILHPTLAEVTDYTVPPPFPDTVEALKID